ncbi:hypothetical protein OB955_21985 [Halobacteria archaeon AArc-m2/3/4]|uniref:Small CPxCG-related zinc finger protein n=1 Tax=Natronoglomus mannanivorans TaxID=2979990 RepID=A0ABT2QKB9_9EURY|nr:hypothetical protein [Halobacteria archaeon AArc-m2/3/4]
MQRFEGERHESLEVLSVLDGDTCSYCENGTLTQQFFQSDEAVVCDECGTPAARLW